MMDMSIDWPRDIEIRLKVVQDPSPYESKQKGDCYRENYVKIKTRLMQGNTLS